MATIKITIENGSEIQAVNIDTGEVWQVKLYDEFEVSPSPVEIIITNNEL